MRCPGCGRFMGRVDEYANEGFVEGTDYACLNPFHGFAGVCLSPEQARICDELEVTA